jgi:hypothetical protein
VLRHVAVDSFDLVEEIERIPLWKQCPLLWREDAEHRASK